MATCSERALSAGNVRVIMSVPAVALVLLCVPACIATWPCNGQKTTLFVAPPGTRDEVRAFCQNAGGDLASLHSREEALEAAELCDPKWQCHIGLQQARQIQIIGLQQARQISGEWRWTDGTPLDYTRWAWGSPKADDTVGFVLSRGGHAGKFKTTVTDCQNGCTGICKKCATEHPWAVAERAAGTSCLLSAQPDPLRRSLRLSFARGSGTSGIDIGIEIASVIERAAGDVTQVAPFRRKLSMSVHASPAYMQTRCEQEMTACLIRPWCMSSHVSQMGRLWEDMVAVPEGIRERHFRTRNLRIPPKV